MLGDVALGDVQSLHDDDMHAANTLHDPERVRLRPNDTARLSDGTLTVTLPPVSWTALTLA
jgi:alpha-N-arabinofuranosidase